MADSIIAILARRAKGRKPSIEAEQAHMAEMERIQIARYLLAFSPLGIPA